MSELTALSAPPPGWYPDRNEANLVRWWDGQQWTDNTQSTAPAAAAFEQPVSADAFGFAASEPVPSPTTTPAIAYAPATPATPATPAAPAVAAAIAPGWYADNSDPTIRRWWDGVQWTAHTAPATDLVPQPSTGSLGSERVSSTRNTMATLALVISIASFAALIFIPVLALALALAGIIMGGVALARARKFALVAGRRGQAIAGIILGAVSIIATVLLAISAFVVYQQVHSTAAQTGTQQSSPQTSTPGGVFFPSTLAELKGVIVKDIGRQDSVVVASVTCDAAASMVTGSTFECAATTNDGRWTPVRVNITYPAESGMAFGLGYGPLLAKNASAPFQAYTVDQVEQEMVVDLASAWRTAVTVVCDPSASAENGSTFRCTIGLDSGGSARVLITMVQPGGYDITVVQPPSAPSGSDGSGSGGSDSGTSPDPDSDPDLSQS